MAEVEIGGTKRGRIAYSFDDIALVPTRRTRNPEEVSTSWKIDAYEFEFPIMAAPMDSVVSPEVAINYGKLGGLAVLNLEGLWTRYEDPKKEFKKIYDFNFDLWCLLEDYCLNGYINSVEIKKNNIDLVKFNKKLPYLIYNSDFILYSKIKYVMQNHKEFSRLEKNKKIDELFAYDFNQYVKIYNPKKYYKLLGIDYVDNLFPANLLEFIKINYNNMEFMIKNLIKILD